MQNQGCITLCVFPPGVVQSLGHVWSKQRDRERVRVTESESSPFGSAGHRGTARVRERGRERDRGIRKRLNKDLAHLVKTHECAFS